MISRIRNVEHCAPTPLITYRYNPVRVSNLCSRGGPTVTTEAAGARSCHGGDVTRLIHASNAKAVLIRKVQRHTPAAGVGDQSHAHRVAQRRGSRWAAVAPESSVTIARNGRNDARLIHTPNSEIIPLRNVHYNAATACVDQRGHVFGIVKHCACRGTAVTAKASRAVARHSGDDTRFIHPPYAVVVTVCYVQHHASVGGIQHGRHGVRQIQRRDRCRAAIAAERRRCTARHRADDARFVHMPNAIVTAVGNVQHRVVTAGIVQRSNMPRVIQKCSRRGAAVADEERDATACHARNVAALADTPNTVVAGVCNVNHDATAGCVGQQREAIGIAQAG